MKSSKIKTTALQVIFASSVIFGAASCEHKDADKKSSDHTSVQVTPDIAEDQNDGKFNESADEKNAAFLLKAAEINLEEISLGKLAQTKSANKDIKELGKMMEMAHTKSLADLTVLAAKKSISIPTVMSANDKAMYDKLEAKSEKDFNKDYADKMVSGHKDAISLFEKQSTDSSDEDIKTWATNMLPSLREHLDQAIAVQDKCSKM